MFPNKNIDQELLKMKRILFVCHGNICRSPMAEFIAKDYINTHNLKNAYKIGSMATSSEEVGNDLYPLAKQKLKQKNIPFGPHEAKRFSKSDYNDWDYILVMDKSNLFDILKIVDDKQSKISLLNPKRDISDPWYTRDFETAYNEIYEAVLAIFAKLEK